MTSRCSWASCTAPATSHVGPWLFCTRHRNVHEEMARRGEIRGQDVPLTKDVDSRPNRELTREELLRAVLAEYARPVPPAAWEVERQREQRRAVTAGRRRVAITPRQVA